MAEFGLFLVILWRFLTIFRMIQQIEITLQPKSTAEIELRPTVGGAIGRKYDPETGTGFWNFK